MADKPLSEMDQARASAKAMVDDAYRLAVETESSVATAMEGVIFVAEEIIDLARQYVAKDMADRSKAGKQ